MSRAIQFAEVHSIKFTLERSLIVTAVASTLEGVFVCPLHPAERLQVGKLLHIHQGSEVFNGLFIGHEQCCPDCNNNESDGSYNEDEHEHTAWEKKSIQ